MNSKRILVLAEREENRLAPLTFELVRVGRELSDKIKGALNIAVLGSGAGSIAQKLSDYGDMVYSLNNPLLSVFQNDIWTHSLQKLIAKIEPEIILFGHTLDNQSLAPVLAFRLGTQSIMDCVGLDINPDSGQLLCTKEVYGGNAIAVFEMEKSPALVTLRPGSSLAAENGISRGEVMNFELALDNSIAKTELVETFAESNINLDKADMIVSGGRGLGKIEGLQQLRELSRALKKCSSRIELGASRPVIDAGWLSSSHQVGLTGEKVNPQVYIAVGISGASQHITGAIRSKNIVAINKDARAPIFKYANYGVVGDYQSVIPAMVKKLGELA
jgi:electron transfer flavoprotein alpha subunit